MQSQRGVRWVKQGRERLTLCGELTEEDWEGEGDMADLDGVYTKEVNGNVLPYCFFQRMNCCDVDPRPLKVGWLT